LPRLPGMAMIVRDLLEEVRLAGASIYLDGDRLRLSGASGLSEELLARIRTSSAEVADCLRGDIEIIPPNGRLPPGEMLADNLHKALGFHAEVLALPVDVDNQRLLYVQSRSADTTLNAAQRMQEASLSARREENRMPSARLLAAVARADAMAEEDRRRDAEKVARDAARAAAIPDPPGGGTP
jgi:hypothetical protein